MTNQQIAESLLNGSMEVYKLKYEMTDNDTLFRILTIVIDKVRPLQVQARSLQCQLDRLKELKVKNYETLPCDTDC